METVGVWRYPVKSLQGEALAEVEVGPAGLWGDRSHALRDPATGVVLTARRDSCLFFGRGLLSGADDDGRPSVEVDVPGHGPTTDAAVISSWIGRPVELIGVTGEPSTYETIVDALDDASDPVAWQGPGWSFHDSTRTQVSLVATGDLGRWDVRRFRPNLVVDGETADVLVGNRVRIGQVELDVVKQIDRCVMITRPQPDGIERDLDVFRQVRDRRGLFLAVGAMVRREGTIRLGDRVEVLGPIG